MKGEADMTVKVYQVYETKDGKESGKTEEFYSIMVASLAMADMQDHAEEGAEYHIRTVEIEEE